MQLSRLLASATLLLPSLVQSAPTQAAPIASELVQRVGSFEAESLIRRRDADFYSVRTRLDRDHSGKAGDPAGKYFHESTFHPHYDGRFADRVLSDDDRKQSLTALMKTYLSTMHDIGAETWIMHGSLLGWWWNRKIMPWDSDVDVQMSESSMRYLANYYNMTVHHFKIPGMAEGRDYMLEVNPNYENGSVLDWLNVIDARWIDTATGLFIDITTLRRNATAEAEGLKGVMMCKDRHHYLERDIFPLRESVFENTPVRIPYAYTDLLEEEYGPRSLTQKSFNNHQFNSERNEWIPDGYYGGQTLEQQQGTASPGVVVHVARRCGPSGANGIIQCDIS